MEITGKIKKIDETKTFGSNGFRKRETVITTDEQYPQMILIEFVQDKCDILDQYSVNDEVKVSINIRGREWVNPEGEAKYFNSIQGWRIEKVQANAPSEIPPVEAVDAFEPADKVSDEEPDDLPF
jgi:translation initiation factor IF-3